MNELLKIIIFFILILIIVFFLLLFSFISHIIIWNFNNGDIIEGELICVANNTNLIKYNVNNTDYYLTATYDKTHNFKNTISTDYKLGDKISVFYNKKSPQKSIILSNNSTFTIEFLKSFVIISLCLGLFYYLCIPYFDFKNHNQKILAKFFDVEISKKGNIIYYFNYEENNKNIILKDFYKNAYFKTILDDCNITDIYCYYSNLNKKACKADFDMALENNNIIVSSIHRNI